MIVSLQILRAICFTGVFLSHCKIRCFEACGAWGVSVFFVLSGFLLMRKHAESFQGGGLSFAWRHIRKVYMLHVVLGIVALIWWIGRAWPFGIKTVVDFALQTIANFLLVQSWIPVNRYYGSLNWVSWFLSSLAFAYMAFPLLRKVVIWFSEKYSPFAGAALVIVVMSLVSIGFKVLMLPTLEYIHPSLSRCDWSCWMTYFCPAYRLGDFLCGCFLGCTNRGCRFIDKHVGTCLSLMIGFVVLSQWLNLVCVGGWFDWFRRTLFLLPSACFTVYVVAAIKPVEHTSGLLRVFLWLGSVSGSAYLMHRLIILFTTMSFGLGEGTARTAPLFERMLIAFIAFVISLLFAKCYDLYLRRANPLSAGK